MIKRYLIAGCLVWVPIWATILVIKFLVDLMDKSLELLPKAYHPDNFLGFHIPGFGLIITILLLFLTGMLVTNFIGRKLEKTWDKVLNRIPVVRSIHSGVKQMLNSVLASRDKAFHRVLLIEYPRKDVWSIAFQTGKGFNGAKEKTGKDLVTIFVPTTPNPTSGFLIFVPSKDVIELDISVDDALRLVMFLGVVLPPGHK